MKKKNIAIIFFLAALVSSCAQMGPLAQIGAVLGQTAGVFSAETAAAISKSGVAWKNAFEEITPEQEYYIGRAVAANVLAAYRLQTNKPGLVSYLNRICNALAVNSPRPDIFNGYHVNLLDSNEINAFATPGGHIFITRGLIECTTSEDTIAAVLAHELAHIQLQHGLKAIKNSRITNALVVTGTSAVSAVTNTMELESIFSDSVGEIFTAMVTNGYSRTQETDADSVAMSLLALAGYEPSSLIEMLRVLEKDQPGHPGGFNKTHPTPAQRITNAQRTVGKYDVDDTRSYRRTRYAAAI
ncbi:MAG: M48 family metalloprotease [Treponema sp.]|jgi:predicted Zn-dependent protease|nr:M48 family metalloprotease [Treponema sp.]